jgi:hypothetical protein
LGLLHRKEKRKKKRKKEEKKKKRKKKWAFSNSRGGGGATPEIIHPQYGGYLNILISFSDVCDRGADVPKLQVYIFCGFQARARMLFSLYISRSAYFYQRSSGPVPPVPRPDNFCRTPSMAPVSFSKLEKNSVNIGALMMFGKFPQLLEALISWANRRWAADGPKIENTRPHQHKQASINNCATPTSAVFYFVLAGKWRKKR